MNTHKALFLDRDGVINQDNHYVSKQEDFFFNTEIFETIRLCKSKNFKIIIITNQSGIGRGIFSIEEYNELNKWMLKRFDKENASIDKVYFCPSHPIKGLGEYKKNDFNRKPNPGMIFQARDEFGIQLEDSILIGDRLSDISAGISAGIKNIIHLKGIEGMAKNLETISDLVMSAENLQSVNRFISKNL